MNIQEPASAANEAGAKDAQEREPASSNADIVIFCHPRNMGNLVQSFQDEIKHAVGALPMRVLWSGVSSVLHQGVMVLEWEGKVTSAFLQSLSIDHEIFDFVVYGWTRTDESQESSREQDEQTVQDAEGN